MANTLLTTSAITKEALRLFRNSNSFIRNVNTEYSDQFAVAGGKIGSTLNIRIPVDYVVRSGATASIQNTVETQTSLTVSTQAGVDFGFSSADLALSIDDFSRRYIAPAVNKLAGSVAFNVLSSIDGSTGNPGAQNFVHAVDAASPPNTITPVASTWLSAQALLDKMSAPRDPGKRVAMLSPDTQSRTVSGLSGFFNPMPTISKQTKTGLMSDILGFDWYMDQVIPNHTTGTFSSGGAVNGASQTGSTLTVGAITGTFTAGDVITIAGVNSINRVTGFSSGTPAQFVITAAVATGATSLPIYPPITPSAGGTVQYATTDVSPANSAVVALVNKPSEVYRANIAYVPEAFTMATVDLPLMGGGVVSEARENYDGVSMRMISYYNGSSDQKSTRLDILYGYKLLRPEWVVRVADAL